jgi:hypothetical protein
MRLHARAHAMPVAPIGKRTEEVVEDKIRKRQVIVISNVRCERAHVLPQRGQIGIEIVATPLAEFLHELRRPVGAEHFQAVAEDGIDGGEAQ